MIKIFSTQLKHGKGGISTALIGYVESLSEDNIPFEVCETHAEKGKFRRFISSVKFALCVKKGDVCWFHLGPWFSISRKLILIFMCKIKGAQIVTHYHSPKTHDYLNNRLGLFVINTISYLSDYTVVLTPWWKRQFEQQGVKNIVVSPNPIDHQLYNLASQNYKKTVHEEKIILSMSRLEKGKGVDKTIEALKYLPNNYILKVAGEGAYLNDLKNLAKDCKVEKRVQFLGWVDYKDKSKLLKEADVFCLPSKLDSFGMVYLEALAANLPVVALNYQAIPDVVPIEFGFLIEEDNPECLSKAIQQAIAMSDINSAEYVINNFSPNIITKRFLGNVGID